MDEAVVGRVRDLRDQVKRTVARLRTAKDRIEAARDAIAAEEQALASARAGGAAAPVGAGRRPRATASRRWRRSTTTEEELDGVGRRDPGRRSPRSSPATARRRCRPGRSAAAAAAADLAGRRPGRLRLRLALGRRCTRGSTSPCRAGTPIRAAASGTVVLLQSEAESGGYGNFTCLDHGGGLSTCYAHQSSFAVSSGQSVSQGDVIGYTGCTGHCFGAHLHFEVRINGALTDPMGYL